MNRLYSMLIFSLLAGCGGGDGSEESTGGGNGSGGGISVQSQDIIKNALFNESINLPISNYIEASGSYKDIHISNFSTVYTPSSPSYCDSAFVEGMVVKVNGGEQAGTCTYEYAVNVDGVESRKSLIRLGFSNISVTSDTLRYSATAALGKTIEIDLSSGLPDGYTIDNDSVIVLGSGYVSHSLLGENKLFYTAGPNEFDGGITRINFNFIGPDKQSVILATIDIAVSNVDLNYAPIAVNFRFGDPSTFTQGSQLDYLPVPVDEEIIIDVSRYFNQGYLDANNASIEMRKSDGSYFFDSNGNQIYFYLNPTDGSMTPTYADGFRLIDPDKQEVQLTDVYSYNSFVSPVNNDTFNSTSFRFKSSKAGLNYVTYVLGDHQGGYSTGIIEIMVGGGKSWASRLTTSKVVYFSPFEYHEIKDSNIAHSGVSREDGIDGPLAENTGLFTYAQAYSFCTSRGLDLPTEQELTNLSGDFPEGLYVSLNKYSPVIADRARRISWPATSNYWSKSLSNNATTTSAVSLASYNVTQNILVNDTSQRYAVTCISRGRIDSVTVSVNNKPVLPFSELAYVQMDVTVVDNQGVPVSNAVVYGVSDKDTFISPVNNGITNTKGIATFRVSSRGVGLTTIDLHSGFDTRRNQEVNFIAIPKYARAGRNSQLCYYNTLAEMAEGDCSKAALISPVNIQGAVYDTIFNDDAYVYRQRAGRLFRVLSLSAAARPLDVVSPVLVANYKFARTGYGYGDSWPTVYDGKYYWFADFNKQKMYAYTRIDDLIKAASHVREVPLDPGAFGFSYDNSTGVYLRVDTLFSGGRGTLRGYRSIEDAAQRINSLPDHVYSYRIWGRNDEKFIVVR